MDAFLFKLKKIVFRVLTFQPLNLILSRAIRYLDLRLPFIFPCVGKLPIKISENVDFNMRSDGGDSIASRLYLYGKNSFESESLDIFTKLVLLNSVNTVFDVGANTGIYSLAASSVDSSVDVYSFEPMPNIYQRLLANVECNSFFKIKVYDIALSDQTGLIDFRFMPSITVPTGGSAAKEGWQGIQKISVRSASLDSFCLKEKVDRLDLIKLDTELTEPSVLKGGMEIISECKPFIICEVLDEHSSNELTLLLNVIGYRFFHISSVGLIEKVKIEHDPSYEFANYLFVHSERYLEFTELCLGSVRVAI